MKMLSTAVSLLWLPAFACNQDAIKETSWQPMGQTVLGTDINPPLMNFGQTIAISPSGTIMAVASDNCVLNGTSYFGCVVVLGHDESTDEWKQKGDVMHGEDPLGVSAFGMSLAISASTDMIVIGSDSDCGEVEVCGAIWIYLWNEKEKKYLKHLGPLCGPSFSSSYGWSLSMSSNDTFLAIGAPGESRVEMWYWDGAERHAYNITSEEDSFGKAVSVSDTGVVAIMSVYNSVSPGVVTVMQFKSGRAWERYGADIDEGLSPCWTTISRDGSVVAVGYPTKLLDGSGCGNGCVRAYRYDEETNAWSLMGQILEGDHWDDIFGATVSLSADGKTLAVGALQEYPFGGYVMVYRYDDEKDYWEKSTDPPLEGSDLYYKFGLDTALSKDGTIVAIGSPWTNRKIQDGCVQVFRKAVGVPKAKPLAESATRERNGGLDNRSGSTQVSL